MTTVPHVLIVDDEPGILEICARALRQQGFEVTTAPDAATARTLLQTKAVDMLISDIRMPDESGISLLQTVREIAPALPLMIITGYPDTDYINSAIDLNVKSFIAKPFNLLDLVNEVKRNLAVPEKQPQKKSDLGKLIPVFLNELRQRQVPVLEGTVKISQESGQAVFIPEGSQGEIALTEWLLNYTHGAPSYIIVLPRI